MNRNTSAWVCTHAPAGTRWGTKTLALLLSLALCLTLLPGAAFAAGESATGEDPALTVTQTVKVGRWITNTEGNAEYKEYQIKDVPCSDDKITDTIENVMVGDKITYTITVVNNTEDAITIRKITGTFNGTGRLEDNDVQINDVKAQTWTSTNRTGREDLVLQPESSGSVPITYVVCYDDTQLNPAELTNTASVEHDGETYSSAPVTIPVNTETFNLVVEKTWWKAPDADVTVQLCKDGDPVEGTETVIKPERIFSSNRTVFENLPLSDFESYSIREVAIDGATLKETDVSVDIGEGDGEKLRDVFVTNDKTAKWYATYSDKLGDDGCYYIRNSYISHSIEVTKEVTKIVRNGTELTDKTTARTGDTITYTITIANNMNNGNYVDVVDQLIGGSSAVKFEDSLLEKNYSTDDQSGLRKNSTQWINVNKFGSLALTATYTVQASDGVYNAEDGKYYLTNTVTVTYDGKTYTDSVKTELEREVYVPIIKTLRNEGTKALKFEVPEDFRFQIEILNAKGERIPRTYGQIEFSEVAAGVSKTKNNFDSANQAVTTALPLTQADYDLLPAENGVKYIWIHEVDDEVDRVTYDSNEYKLYLVPEKEVSHTLYAVADWDWDGDMDSLYDHAVRFTNYYDKQEHRDDTGSGSYTLRYTVTVEKSTNGSVSADRKTASRGTTVTVTVIPDKGYTLETLTVTDKNGKEVKLTEKNGKYTFTMPASSVTVKATFMDDNTMLNFFVDVKASDYYYDAVLWAAQNGITSGTDDTHFSPNQPCTRAQIVTFLWRTAGSPVVNYAMNMTDVSEDAYYAEAVRWALSEGITTGTTATTFSPDETCTRAQAVTFLARALNAKASGKAAFSDVPTGSYYADAVAWAVENGVTNGIADTLFGPDNSCTRGQIVTFLWRAYSK